MSMINYQPPALAKSLVRFFAGPELHEVVLGDMQEKLEQQKFQQQQIASRWYWSQSLRSIPSFTSMHLQALGRRELVQGSLYIVFALALISIWEIFIARQYSWPIAKQILDYSPLSVGNTCRAVYIILYGAFVMSCVKGLGSLLKWRHKGEHFCKAHTLVFAIVASFPVLYLMVFPLATDGSALFRVAQLVTVWSLVLLALVLPAQAKFKYKIT